MQGKYGNSLKFNIVRAQRALLRTALRGLVRWEPIQHPKPGYTILIGCNASLAPILGADLRMLANQKLPNLDKIIAVFDRPKNEIQSPVEERLRKDYPSLPLTFIYYSRFQAKLLGAIGWGWAYSWLSWSIGLAATRTRYAFIQDYDALLLHPDIIERHYAAIGERGDQYVGINWYSGNGVLETDRFVTTPEMMFDAAFVRERFRPIDLFNHVAFHAGRSVDFDTFLHAQATAGKRSRLAIPEDEMVHPSQMICQFTYMMSRAQYIPPDRNNLLMIPYYMYLGGNECALQEQMTHLESSDGRIVEYFGKRMDMSQLTSVHAAWLAKQAFRLERALYGFIRPKVEAYFTMIEHLVLARGTPGGVQSRERQLQPTSAADRAIVTTPSSGG